MGRLAVFVCFVVCACSGQTQPGADASADRPIFAMTMDASDAADVTPDACSPSCASGQVCIAGSCFMATCTPACAAGETCIGTRCVASADASADTVATLDAPPDTTQADDAAVDVIVTADSSDAAGSADSPGDADAGPQTPAEVLAECWNAICTEPSLGLGPQWCQGSGGCCATQPSDATIQMALTATCINTTTHAAYQANLLTDPSNCGGCANACTTQSCVCGICM